LRQIKPFVGDILAQLNPEQRNAVEAVEGPIMVVAGAGSGKTRVLTYRVAHLLNVGVDPFNILALTFTNKAAREMKDRIIQLVGNADAKNVWMGTFHSIFARSVKNGMNPNVAVDRPDQLLHAHFTREVRGR
jgi:DNA helicase-2/ATP-dependent DNA helicase PcrA